MTTLKISCKRVLHITTLKKTCGNFEKYWHTSRLGICQKIYTTKFSDEIILHTENALIETFFARDKQRKCIIISNLALFWLKLNSYYESLHLGVCKLAKYVRNCVVFWKKLHSSQKFYTTAGRSGRDKFQVWMKYTRNKSIWKMFLSSRQECLVTISYLWKQRL